MNCRGCGRRIPESYLRQDSFECPYCGRRYRRTVAKAPSNADALQRRSETASRSRAVWGNARPVMRRNVGILERIKHIALQRVWKLPLIAWAAVILLVGIAGNSAFEDHETEKYAQLAADKAQVKTEFEQTMAALESATETPTPTVTEAPEMTVIPTLTAAAAVNMVSTDSLCGMIESVVAQNFEHYNVSARDDIITVNLWQEGIAAALALSTAREATTSERNGTI